MAILTPILLADGTQFMSCDGQMRFMFNVRLTNKIIVKSYIFGNLVTDPNKGADIILWSAAYGPLHPKAQWGSIGDLHQFPNTCGGGRQGESERTFPSGDGILIPDNDVFVAAIGWGGGTLEIYAQIWVRDP